MSTNLSLHTMLLNIHVSHFQNRHQAFFCLTLLLALNLGAVVFNVHLFAAQVTLATETLPVSSSRAELHRSLPTILTMFLTIPRIWFDYF